MRSVSSAASLLSKLPLPIYPSILLPNVSPRYAPFVYDTWKSPETLAIISKIAGVDLVTEMDFEIAHINISVKSDKQKEEEVQAFVDKQAFEEDEGIAGCPWEDDKPIVDVS